MTPDPATPRSPAQPPPDLVTVADVHAAATADHGGHTNDHVAAAAPT